MTINIRKIRKIAAKETIKKAKQELLKMKERKEKVNPKEFEEYVKILYDKTFDELKKEAERKKIQKGEDYVNLDDY